MGRFFRRNRPLNRRALLRGAGASLGLPLLDAMVPGLGAPSPERRLVWVYAPNGVNLEHWRPRLLEHEKLELHGSLAPLRPFADRVSVLRGLSCRTARANGDGPGDHARAAASWLTCVQPLKADGAVRVARSADQVAAEWLSRDTLFRSLALGGEAPRTAGQCDSGYSCAYSSHISWRSPGEPLSKESDPRWVFDLLFRGGFSGENGLSSEQRLERNHQRQSLLDYISGDAKALRSNLGGADRQTLDRYLESLRELERRLLRFEEGYDPSVGNEHRPGENPADIFERLRLMSELVALAFATDRTRVVTLLFANEGSNRSFPGLGIGEGHHTISHHGDDPKKLEQIAAIDRAYVETFAHLLGRLDAHREGDTTLLDQSAVVYGSCIADGNKHIHDDLPILLAGRLAGDLRPGRHVLHERETPLANLHLTLQRMAGCEVRAFADSTGCLGAL